MNIKYILIFPFISSLCIVLNLYNGDVLGIDCNFEYLLWYIPPLFLFIYKLIKKFNQQNLYNYIIEILVCLFSIVSNIYWHYAWIKDAKTNFRHRTEYYDTQCLISAFLFNILYFEIKKNNQDQNRITQI